MCDLFASWVVAPQKATEENSAQEEVCVDSGT